jgi:hypothetical protein
MNSSGYRSLRAMTAIAVLAAATNAWSAPVITSIVVTGSDAPIAGAGTTVAQVENDLGGGNVPFGEDKFVFLDRTHQHNGARFTAAGLLTATNPPVAGDVTIGLPSYLLGGEYIGTMQGNRDNPNYRMDVTVAPPVNAYLLIDNRVGENPQINTTPPTLGAVMGWVAADGWMQMNTGISPNGQPDFTAVDEGGTPANFAARTNPDANRGVGPGVLINQFFTVYHKSFPAGSVIPFKEQNFGGINMYSVVIQPVPEPSTVVMAGMGAIGLLYAGYRRRRQAA